MTELTLEKLKEISQHCKKYALKPYKGFLGLGPEGLFEIQSQEELNFLKQTEDGD
jgi:hypothetical protein